VVSFLLLSAVCALRIILSSLISASLLLHWSIIASTWSLLTYLLVLLLLQNFWRVMTMLLWNFCDKMIHYIKPLFDFVLSSRDGLSSLFSLSLHGTRCRQFIRIYIYIKYIYCCCWLIAKICCSLFLCKSVFVAPLIESQSTCHNNYNFVI